VATALHGRTSLPGLFAVGEAACTGLHGANRLASNSLLEAVVLAHDGAAAAEGEIARHPAPPAGLPAWIDGAAGDPDERVVLTHNWDELRRTMWDYVGIVRSTKRLQRARTRIGTLGDEIREYYWNFRVEPRLLELRNLIQVAELIIDCALQRRESRGLHFTLDYPAKQTEARHTSVRRPQGRP
jgi:L-aspartate oxidase